MLSRILRRSTTPRNHNVSVSPIIQDSILSSPRAGVAIPLPVSHPYSYTCHVSRFRTGEEAARPVARLPHPLPQGTAEEPQVVPRMAEGMAAPGRKPLEPPDIQPGHLQYMLDQGPDMPGIAAARTPLACSTVTRRSEPKSVERRFKATVS